MNETPVPSSLTPSLATPAPEKPPVTGGFLHHMKSVFIGGLFALIPLFVTLWVLSFLDHVTTDFSFPLARFIVTSSPLHSETGWNTTAATTVLSSALALVLFLCFVYAIGALSTFVIGRKLLAKLDHFVENLPLLKSIYGTTKQVMSVFRQGGGGAGFQRVVLVEFPRAGIWALAFVTNEVTDISCGKKYVAIFIPMTPNPTSGFFQLVPIDDVRNTDWTVDQGIKIVLSGGLLAPRELNFGRAGKDSIPPAAPAVGMGKSLSG